MTCPRYAKEKRYEKYGTVYLNAECMYTRMMLLLPGSLINSAPSPGCPGMLSLLPGLRIHNEPLLLGHSLFIAHHRSTFLCPMRHL